MKNLLFTAILLASCLTQAICQKAPLVASLKYSVLYTPSNKLVIRDMCELDISKTESYYYSLGEIQDKKKLTEQIKLSMATGQPLKRSSSDRNHYVSPFKIYKKYDTKKAVRLEFVGQQFLGVVVDDLDPSRWKILKDTKIINNYKCRKAVLKKDTAVVTVWFCQDIPVNDGPNIYYGLPGAIVEATSNTGYTIKLLSVSFNKDPKNTVVVPSYLTVTRAQFDKAVKNTDAAFLNGQMPNGIEVKKTSGDD